MENSSDTEEGVVAVWAGDNLIQWIELNAAVLSDGGMLKRILAAVKIFAQTKLREAAKAPSSDPFSMEEFERERVLHKIMERLLRGLEGG